ncbi:unnamed protein product [Closterium sp. NIES-54]
MTVPLPSTPPPPRDFLTEYSLGRHLGKGAFGEVLECTHNATGRQFACKRIGKRLITSESDAAEVRKEVAILQQLTAAGPSRHGGIVQLVEALEDGVAVYLVMELCEGGDLFELIKSDHAAGMPEDMAREIFHQVALAVAYCHTRGVLHRDIKPENILFTGPNQPAPVADSGAEFGAEFGVESVAAECSQKDFGDSSAAEWRWRVRVADFGLALFLPHGHMGHGMAGSRFYTAPEMVRGRKYGKRADVWSMAVVLCAMLTGRVPFAGKDRADAEGLRRSILRGAINFSAPAWASVSASARDLVRRMLEVDPRRRLKAAEVLQHPWVLGLELPDLTAADAAADVVMSADPAGSEEKVVPVKAQAESNLAVAAKASCPVDSKEAGEEERERTMNAKQNEFQQQTEQQAEGSTQMVSSSAAPPPVAPPVFSPRAPPTAPRVASPIRSAAFPIRPASPDRPVGSPIPIRPIAQPPLASNVSHSGCPSLNSPCPSQSSAFQSTPPSSASRPSPSRSSPPPLSSSLSPSLSNSTATSASTFTQMDAADMDECGMADGAGGFDVMAADGMAGDASLSIPLSLCLPPISVCRKKSRREEYEEAFVPGSPWFSPRPLPLTAGQLSHKQQQQQQQESVRKEYEEASLAFSPWFSPRPLPLVAAPFSHEKQQHKHRYHQQQQQQQQVHCPVGSSLSGDEFSNNSSMCGASSALSFQAASRCFMAFNPWGSLRIHTVPNTTTTTTTTSGFSGGNGGTTHAPDSGIEAPAEGFKKSHLQPLYNENQPPVNHGGGDGDWVSHAEGEVPLASHLQAAAVCEGECYTGFLPWCVGSHVLWWAPDGMGAELEIGFYMLREKYLSRVTYKRPYFVTVSSVLGCMNVQLCMNHLWELSKARSADTGLFHHLDNHWEFAPGRLPGSCLLSFSVDFQFRSLLYTQFLDLFFDEVVSSLVNSFERRCKEIYESGCRFLSPPTLTHSPTNTQPFILPQTLHLHYLFSAMASRKVLLCLALALAVLALAAPLAFGADANVLGGANSKLKPSRRSLSDDHHDDHHDGSDDHHDDDHHYGDSNHHDGDDDHHYYKSPSKSPSKSHDSDDWYHRSPSKSPSTSPSKSPGKWHDSSSDDKWHDSSSDDKWHRSPSPKSPSPKSPSPKSPSPKSPSPKSPGKWNSPSKSPGSKRDDDHPWKSPPSSPSKSPVWGKSPEKGHDDDHHWGGKSPSKSPSKSPVWGKSPGKYHDDHDDDHSGDHSEHHYSAGKPRWQHS